MSEATEADFGSYLEQQASELRIEATRRQAALEAHLVRLGQFQSGAGIKMGAQALDELLCTYFENLRETLDQWPGPNLGEAAARDILSRHLHHVIQSMVIPELAYRSAAKAGVGSGAIEALLELVRQKLRSRAHLIELGVQAKPAVQSVITNTVTAGTVLGSVLQGGTGASQSATVTINVAAIAEALGELKAQLPLELQSAIAPDADTIKAQLAKVEPSRTILQEAGKSIRTIVEGAAGGLLGNAAPAALPVLLAAIGLG